MVEKQRESSGQKRRVDIFYHRKDDYSFSLVYIANYLKMELPMLKQIVEAKKVPTIEYQGEKYIPRLTANAFMRELAIVRSVRHVI